MSNRLNQDQLDDIRAHLAQGMTPGEIANYYGRVADLDLIEVEEIRTAAYELQDEMDPKEPPR